MHKVYKVKGGLDKFRTQRSGVEFLQDYSPDAFAQKDLPSLAVNKLFTMRRLKNYPLQHFQCLRGVNTSMITEGLRWIIAVCHSFYPRPLRNFAYIRLWFIASIFARYFSPHKRGTYRIQILKVKISFVIHLFILPTRFTTFSLTPRDLGA